MINFLIFTSILEVNNFVTNVTFAQCVVLRRRMSGETSGSKMAPLARSICQSSEFFGFTD